MTKIDAVSITAPAYEEAAGIRQLVCHWLEFLKSLAQIKDFEIVICDDGSGDATSTILAELANQDCRVKPVRHAVNQGAAAALTTAIRHTRLPWVLILDADGQYAIDDLPLLIRAIESNGACAAMGVRLAKRDSAFTRIGSKLSCMVCNWVHGTRYRDFFCALMLVDGQILRSLPLEAKGLNYSGDITSKLTERGIQLAEVEIQHQARISGRSSAQNLRSVLHRFLFVLYVGFRQYLLRRNVLQRRLDHGHGQLFS